MARRQRDPALERQWRERVARWATSGLSVRAFCLQHGLIETSFHYWKRELRARDAAVASPAKSPTRKRPLATKSPPVFVRVRSVNLSITHKFSPFSGFRSRLFFRG